MGYRTTIMGRGLARHGDKTSTGATCIGSLPDCTEHNQSVICVGDKTTPCEICGKPGTIIDGVENVTFHGAAAAVDRSNVRCGCPPGTNYIIVPADHWPGSGPSPQQTAQEKCREQEAEHNRVFAKSCLRGEGCNDAGDQSEPQTNFAEMAFFQALLASEPTTDYYPQAAVTTASTVARAQKATPGASVLELISGRALTYGSWAVRGTVGLGEIAAVGAGAPVAGLLVGMMPGRLNDGEQDFIDRMRLEQMRKAPTRVRYTWEENSEGKAVSHGWHTPPGKDHVRVRKMEWDSAAQSYTFTTEENPRITLLWTPDHSGVNTPSNTGNQAQPMLPNPVIVDPLPDNTRITATTSPAAEEKNFADYILILPFPDLPPIYIYLSKPPLHFMEVELYSDFMRRSRQGKYEADHMPSAAAVRVALLRENPRLSKNMVDKMAQDVAAIVVPKEVHQKLSDTYGGRNTPAQIELDSMNLRAAADRNLDSIKPALKENGATEAQIEASRAKMHELNRKIGLYK